MDENPDLRKGMDRNLYIASERGDAKLLDQVLEEGKVDFFAEVTPMGDTALHTAAFHGHTQLVRKLIQLASGNPEAGKQFLKAQNTTDENTALHVAAKRGFVEIVKLLVEKDKDLACVKNNAGETALFKACENGNVGMVECLLECTPESEELDRRADGQTPLHVAVSELHEGVTTKLLDERPALADRADVSKMTALHMLALVPFALVPASWKEMWSPVVIRRIATMLLNKGISLMYRVDANGQSALHVGSKAGNSLVRNILSRGTDGSHTVDNESRTALHVAVENASQIYMRNGRILREIILLLASSRLIDCSDGSEETALDIAIRKTEDDPQLFLSVSTVLISIENAKKSEHPNSCTYAQMTFVYCTWV